MAEPSRPVSPHLQIYRWQITMALSILHRASGVFLSLGAVVLVWWLIAAEQGVESFDQAQKLLTSTLGQLCLFAWTAAFFLHLCNGVRHLFWDVGLGFEKSTSQRSGWLVMVLTALLTAGTWIVGLDLLGAPS